MANKVFNDALKGLFLTNKTITPLKPIFQNSTGAQGDCVQLLDVGFQFVIRQTAEGSVGRGAESVDGGEFDFWRWCCAAAGRLLTRRGLPCRGCVGVVLRVFAFFAGLAVGSVVGGCCA